MRRAAATLTLLFLLGLGACVDLAKVDPGPRFIDDFEDGGAPTWSRFSPWTCDEISGAAVGKDAGARDGGVADAGQPAPDAAVASTCKLSLERPGSDDQQALESVFTIEPLDGVHYPGTEIVSRTVGHGTVDVTGFTQLVFAAILESTPPAPALPSGTQLFVALGCSALSSDPLATSQPVPYTLNAGWTELRLSLSTFTLTNTPRSQACLALVDKHPLHRDARPGKRRADRGHTSHRQHQPPGLSATCTGCPDRR
jgi:hypothetical protein